MNIMNRFEYIKDSEMEKMDFTKDDVTLPRRSTKHSAGYDFYAPYDFTINPHDKVVVKTGVKCKLDNDKVLLLNIRSSLGIKRDIMMSNTIGVIDADYYGNIDNDGHIMIGLRNLSDDVIKFYKGNKICQGLIMSYFVTDDDDVNSVRVGGVGSTGK